nr:hypothetical protein [Lactiplantibacillus carotarum]
MQVIQQKLTGSTAQLTGFLHEPDLNAHQTNLPAIIIVPGGLIRTFQPAKRRV